MNKIIEIGNLTRDAEKTTTNNGISICRFSIAVNRRHSNEENAVDYFNCVAWRNLADTVAPYLTKGKKVAVVGSLQTRTFEAENGTKKTVYEINVEELEFLSKTENKGNFANEKGIETKLTPTDDEDLPF